MLRVRKSARAERDLINIWHHGYERWGAAQADRYVDEIEEAIERLRSYPGSGVDAGHIRPGVRRWRSGVHHIYYAIGTTDLHIVRVLSSRQEPEPELQ